MKMFFKNIKHVASVGALAVATLVIPASCIEEPESQVSGKGTDRIRMEADEFNVVTFTPNSIETKSLVTIFRDAISSASMNQSVTVNLELNQDSLDAYNEEHETDYVLLDPAAYELSIDPGNVTFAPGESAKTIRITLNTGLLDLSKKHVLPLVIRDPSNGFVANERFSKAIIQTLPINQWDGVYEVTGEEWTDAVVATITSWYPFDWYAETTGENSIIFWDPYFETYYHPISSGGAQSAYGGFGVEMEIDPATGLVVDMWNPWGNPHAGTTRNLLWDPADGNKVNADGSIDLKYHMTQSSLVPAPPHIRTSFDEHMEYVGPR